MKPAPENLRALQDWMQLQLMSSATGADPDASIEKLITTSRQQTSRERLNVYCQAYVARLVECLREEFATLCKFLEPDVFDSLAVAYLEAHPSQSYTLANLGAEFPRFLQTLAASEDPDRPAALDAEFQGARFLIELATLERLYAEVFDGPGLEGLPSLSHEKLRQIQPEAWPRARFEFAPCFRLVQFASPVHEFITACRQGAEPPVPEPRPTWLAVTRRQYIVRRHSLTQTQFELLRCLGEGQVLGAALEHVAAMCPDVEALVRDIQQWFQEWTAAQFFQSIQVDHPPAC